MGDGKPKDDRSIAAQAGRWLLKLNSADATERAALATWLMQSPKHIDEFLRSTAFHQELAEKVCAAVEEGWTQVVSSQPVRQRVKPRRRRRVTVIASLAGILGVAAIAAIPILKSRTTTQAPVRTDLQFAGETLGEAAAEFNRHNTRQLFIADPSIAALRIYGRFPARDVEGFAAALREPFGIQTARPGGNVIHLEPRDNGHSN